MTVEDEIHGYIASQPEPKRGDLHTLDGLIRDAMPGCRLWFLDGTNDAGKIVSNPNIGYGSQVIDYADGQTRDFYLVGLSANTGGISVYILGFADKTYLARTYGGRIGRASVTGYCIKFRALKGIDPAVLTEAIRDRLSQA